MVSEGAELCLASAGGAPSPHELGWNLLSRNLLTFLLPFRLSLCDAS
jgi:hypothetical protein